MTINSNAIIATSIAALAIYNENVEPPIGVAKDAAFLISAYRDVIMPAVRTEAIKLGVPEKEVDALAPVMSLICDSSDMVSMVLKGTPMADIYKELTDNEIQHDDLLMNIKAMHITPHSSKGTFMTEPTADEPTAAVVSAIEIPASHSAAINAVLSGATGGKVNDINAIFRNNAVLESELAAAKGEITKLAMAATRVAIPTTGTTAGPTGPLTFNVVNKQASDIFKDGSGRRAAGLSFDVPTLEWKDAAGNVVEHPEVPTIDPNYDFDTTQILQFLTAMQLNMNTWLFGHTGTGKSTFVEQVAARIGWPVTRINLDSNLERADLVGQVTLVNEGGTTTTKFEEGILPRAMQRPGFFLMDEIDAGRPDILFVVQRALENKGLMLTEDGGRIVQPHPLFRFTATANTRGQGDEYGMYQGTKTMNASMIDRFTGFIEFKYMDAKREAALLRKICPALDPKRAQDFAQFAADVRTAFVKAEVYNTISPRGLFTMANTYCTFTGMAGAGGKPMPEDVALGMAMNMSVLNKVTNDTSQKFKEIASRIFKASTK